MCSAGGSRRTQTFIFSNAAAELLNLHYPYPLSPEKHSSPDHLHTHQTVSISITMMRPSAPIYPSLHLGVIRCDAFLRKIRKPSVRRYSSDLSVLHMVAYYCCSPQTPHHFLHVSPHFNLHTATAFSRDSDTGEERGRRSGGGDRMGDGDKGRKRGRSKDERFDLRATNCVLQHLDPVL